MDRHALSPQQRAWLVDALDDWRKQNLVSSDQAAGILALYESPAEMAQRQQSRAIFTLMAIAALLVGLAVLLLIGYNWEDLPRAVKLVVIFGVILGTYVTAFHLRYKTTAKTLSEVAFFLGCVFYGAGIWLVAQVFNLNAHYPDGFWWWALGILPFALCLDTALLHALYASVLAAWVGTEILGFPELGGWFFGRWQLVPNGAYTLPLLALPGLAWSYRKRSPVSVGLYVMLMTWWVTLQPFAWHDEGNPIYFIGAVGGLLLLLAECHRTGSLLAVPYRQLGVLLSAGVLVPLSYYSINTDRFGGWSLTSVLAPLAIAVMAAAILTLTEAIRSRAPELPAVPKRLQQLLYRQALPLGQIAFMVGLALWRAATVETLAGPARLNYAEPVGIVPGALVTTILANAALVGFAMWLIRLGLREDRGQPFAAGVGLFLIWMVLRYIDLFGNFGGMLGAAAMFFLCGAALFGVAFYWRRRKEVQHA